MMKRLAGLLLAATALAGCSDSTGPRRSAEPLETASIRDACNLLTPSAAQEVLGRGFEKEPFESGIGPGCVYRDGDRKIGMNRQRGRYPSVNRWEADLVGSYLAGIQRTQDPKVTVVDDVGDGAKWVVGNTVRVLYVVHEGTAFDVFIDLGPRVSTQELLREAKAAARAVIANL